MAIIFEVKRPTADVVGPPDTLREIFLHGGGRSGPLYWWSLLQVHYF